MLLEPLLINSHTYTRTDTQKLPNYITITILLHLGELAGITCWQLEQVVAWSLKKLGGLVMSPNHAHRYCQH